MGNRGLLTKLGFKITKRKKEREKKRSRYGIYYTYPCDLEIILQLIPDPVHVVKNWKEMAIENQFIYLPQNVVELYNLPTLRKKYNQF